MALDTWFLYLVAIFVVILIPGPLSLFMVSNTLRMGIVKTYPAFLGGVSASSLYLVLSATGLGALIIAQPNLFAATKLAGVAYLLYLGVQTLVASFRTPAHESQTDTLETNKRGLFQRAFFLGASNPKDMLFFMAFLPQFLSTDTSLNRQLVVIVGSWVVVDLLCKLLYGFLAKSVQPIFHEPKRLRWFDRFAGALYCTAAAVAVWIV